MVVREFRGRMSDDRYQMSADNQRIREEVKGVCRLHRAEALWQEGGVVLP